MVVHVVVFTWTAGISVQQVKHLSRAFDELATEVSHIVEIQHGPDLNFREGNGDYGLVVTFRDRAAWDAYQAHPKHKALVRDVVAPIQASRVAIQFSPGEASI